MEVIEKEFIYLDTKLSSQEEVFAYLSNVLVQAKRGDDVQAIMNGFYQRESEFSTAMDDGIAIPHCRVSAIQDATVIIIRNKNMVKWTKQEDVDLFFALMIPQSNENQMHIKILAQVAQLIMEDDYIELVRYSDDPGAIYDAMADLNTLLQ